METLDEFLIYAHGAREVSLIIANSADSFDALRHTLGEKGFCMLTSPFEYDQEKCARTAYILTEEDEKDLYDFVLQYPTGQIDISNLERGNIVTIPEYDSSTTLLLVTSAKIAASEERGFNFRELVGLTQRI